MAHTFQFVSSTLSLTLSGASRVARASLAGVAFAAIGCVSSAALAAGPAPSAKKADTAKGGEIVTKVCAACHNVDGNSAGAPNPKLAGQHPEYIAKQLNDYKSKKRENAVMLGFSAALSEDDIRNVSAYFAEQKPKEGAAKTVAGKDLGKQIYRGGIAEKGVPACAGCHGAIGAGMPSQYPRLAGQHADYTVEELKDFSLGKRANDQNKMMRSIAAKMNEAEMKAVADYIAGLK
jgi:cytochrome c553